jgi:hypothetical protein
MMDPAEQQAFLASTLALGQPPAAGSGPSSIGSVEAAGQTPAGDPLAGGPAPGIAPAGAAQPGFGPEAPPVGTQKTDAPFSETTSTTPTLAPQAVAVQKKIDAAQQKYQQAEQMTIPVEKVQPFAPDLDPFEYQQKGGQTAINAGQFQDLAEKYKTQQDAKVEADYQKSEADRAADNQKRLSAMMAAADARWSKVADMAKPENMMPSPSFATKLVQAVASGLSTWANIKMGHSGISPVDQMLNEEANREFASRKDALAAERDAAEKLGQRPRDFQAAMLEQDKLKQQRLADLQRAAALQVKKMADVFPTKARELQMQSAELERKGLETQRDLFVKELTRKEEEKNTGPKTETVTALAGGTGKEDARQTPTTKETTDYTQAQEMGAKAQRMRELAKQGEIPTPEENNQIADNKAQMAARMHREMESQGQAVLGKALRYVDMAPSQIYPEGMSEGKKEYDTLRGQIAEQRAINVAGTGFMGNPMTYMDVMGRYLPQRQESEHLGRVKDEGLMSFAEQLAKSTREISKAGKGEQKIGEQVTPEQKRIYAQPGANPLEPPPALQPGQKPTDASGKNRWSELPKETRADLGRASKILTNPKASKAQKAAAARFTRDAAEGKL